MTDSSKLCCSLSVLVFVGAAVLVHVSQAQERGSGCLTDCDLTLEDSTNGNTTGNRTCKTLYLLNIVPFPVPGEESWDGGYEVIPAGLLAAKHINNRSDILGGYNLEIINLNSEACGISPATLGVVNFYETVVNMDVDSRRCIVGVVGLYCSSVTQNIAPLARLPEIDYVTLAASTASSHRDVSQYPQLFHSIASFAVVKESVVAMMRRFNWTRIGLVNDNNGVFFYSTANAFAKKIISEPDLNLIAHLPLLKNNLNDVLRKLINAEARISFWSVSAEQAANVLCEAYREKLVWEGYVYIFHGHNVSEILNANTTCTHDELVSGSHGIFILNYKLTNSNQSLVSGITYEQYYREFEEEVSNFAREKKTNISVLGDWPNSLYDQIWAYALALNATVDYINHTFDNLDLGNKSPVFADKIISELEKMSFQGASGHVQFGMQHEVQTAIDIIQVLNGTGVHVGIFDPYSKNIILLENIDAPSDTFQIVYKLIPIYLGVIVCVVQLLLFVLITFNLVAIIGWRKKRHIRAISPLLSILMFVGCYLLCAAPVFQTFHEIISFHNLERVFSALCNIEFWLFFNGVNLIFATLFMRLLRIYHIFRVFRRMNRYWSDHFLFLYVILICSFQVFILIIWSGADPLVRNDTDKRQYIPSAHPPYYEAIAICVSKNIGIWFGISYIYSGLMMVIVMFLAIQTRHIKRQEFKDTKKVNAFIFLVVAVVAVGTPLQYLFAAIRLEILEFIAKWLIRFLIPLLCQALLFLPKTLPTLLPCFKPELQTRRKSTVISLVEKTHELLSF